MKEMRLNHSAVFKLVLVTALFIGGLGLLEGQEFAGGQGTEADPWQIATAEHLNNLRNYLGEEHSDKHFLQIANICLYDATREGGAFWNEGEGWLPVGDLDIYFWGNYDGNVFIVDGLYINRPETICQGLFGLIHKSVIKNLNVTNVDINGGVVTGGLTSFARKSIIKNCYSTGSVTGDGTVGGLVGIANDSTFISSSYSTGTVTGNRTVGGLVGSASSGNTIISSYSTGSVTGDDTVGGFVGLATELTMSNCYSTGNVRGRCKVGGLVGRISQESTISNCYSTGSVIGYHPSGGLMAGVYVSTISSSYWDMETSGMERSDGGEGRTTDQMTYPYSENTYVGWDFDEIWKADEDHSVNSGYPFLREASVSVEDDFAAEIPSSPVLTNYPNPFNPETTIRFNVEEETEVTLSIFNIKGQLVKTLHSGIIKAGVHSLIWNGKDDNGRDVSSGVYFYRLTTGDYDKVNKMLLVK